MAETARVTLLELANALGMAVQARYLSTEIAGSAFKKYLRDNSLLSEKEVSTSIPKKKAV